MSKHEAAVGPDDYAVGVSDIMESPWGAGMMVSATGGDRGANPHPIEGADWQEWLRGFEAWEVAPKVTIEVGHV